MQGYLVLRFKAVISDTAATVKMQLFHVMTDTADALNIELNLFTL